MSLRATDTPWSGPMKRPSRASMSRCTATRAAASRSRCTQALRVGSTASMRLRHEARRFEGESAPERMRRAASAAVTSYRSGMRSSPEDLLEGVENFRDHFESAERGHEVGPGVLAPELTHESLRRLDLRPQSAISRFLHACPDGIGDGDAGHLVGKEL